jgi:hypothetical protein
MGSSIRQFHRWMAGTFLLAFVVNIIVNFVVKMPEQVTQTIGLATLLPLGLLMLTGLYMLVLPYVRRG